MVFACMDFVSDFGLFLAKSFYISFTLLGVKVFCWTSSKSFGFASCRIFRFLQDFYPFSFFC